MRKIALAVPALTGVGSAFAQTASGITTYSDPGAAITAIGNTAQSAFDTFGGTIVPLLLGGLVVVGGLSLGKWIIKKIRP